MTRAKTNLDFSRRSSRRVDKTTGLRSDQTIVLNGPKTSTLYPDPLRRISYSDPETGKRFVFLTNNFDLPALTIANIYKKPMASRAVLSMDQAKFENQIILWDFTERSEDTSLDRDLHLRAGGDRSQGIEGGAVDERNLANSERVPFRENPYI